MNQSLPALCAALVTPISAQGEVMVDRLVQHANWVLANGCDGVTLFGTTGEASSFGLATRMATLEAALQAGLPSKAIILGTGCCSVEDSLLLTRHALGLGVTTSLIHPPFFFPDPGEDGIVAFFSALAEGLEGTAARIIFYHFPDMTRAPITHGAISRLTSDFKGRFVGLKDSTGDLEGTIAFARAFPELKVFSGDDDLLWPLLAAGGHGAITATANLVPNLLSDIRAGWQDNTQTAQTAHAAVVGLWSQTLLKFPVSEAVKYIIAQLAHDEGWEAVCPPLQPLPKPRRDQLDAMVRPYAKLFPAGLGQTRKIK